MISEKDFDKRIRELYKSQQTRLASKQKSRDKRKRPLRGAYPLPERLPFDVEDLALKIWRIFGLSARACRYCCRPIDVFSLSLDHHNPLKYGGTWELDNLDVDVCQPCNAKKGALPCDDWMKLLECRRSMSPVAQLELDTILANAGPGMSSQWKAWASKGKTTNRGVSLETQRALLQDNW
jgi:5-methylcytosine-specific restriction endonuclease McrA